MRKVLSLLFVIFISILIVGCDKKSNIDDFVFSGSNLVEYKGTSENVEIPESYEKDSIDAYVVTLGEVKEDAFKVATALRRNNVKVDIGFTSKGMKAQIKIALRKNAKY